MGKEFRSVSLDKIKIEAIEEEVKIITGYVNKFNELSEDLGFFETVKPGAFKRSLESNKNILALFDHDTSKILGSTNSETLILKEDDIGLYFELKLNNNLSYTRDILELIEMKVLSNCSFGFKINQDEWEEKEGSYYRNLLDIELMEITLTGLPAYTSSEFSLRSLDNFKEGIKNEKNKEIETRKLKLVLELLKMK
jgi:HK97 family phage prohead protease